MKEGREKKRRNGGKKTEYEEIKEKGVNGLGWNEGIGMERKLSRGRKGGKGRREQIK